MGFLPGIKNRRALPAIHPGKLFQEEVMPALGKSKVEIAQLLGIGRQTLYDFIDGRRGLTAQLALRIGKLCGNGPDLWLNLQRDFDLAQARLEIGAELEKIPTLEAETA